ncbi:MAG: RnfABCDGE type electron transport complex subunit G [Clostridiales bacterium]|nr:RnfABCDGE type electron transport complex subunit G [Clostridiales bacterium]
MKSFKEIVKPALILFAICLVATALLALTNKVTAPKIKASDEKAEADSCSEVLPDAKFFGEAETLKYNGKEYICYEGINDNDEIVGYVFKTSSKGYKGDVTVMTGIGPDGSVTGVAPLNLNETPGLGMNAKKDSFRSQFIGKTGVIGVSKAGHTVENGIDALTGATITSKAVAESINIAIELFGVKTGGVN